MKTALRCRIATLALALLVVWPPIQHALTRAFDMNPWAFFGFAMYTVPSLRINVRTAVLDPEADARLDWNLPPRAARGRAREFAVRRASYGDLLPPDELADEILAADPSLPGVAVRVTRWELDRASARLAERDREWRYPRSIRRASD